MRNYLLFPFRAMIVALVWMLAMAMTAEIGGSVPSINWRKVWNWETDSMLGGQE